MTTETTEPTQTAVCPFCFKPMVIEGNAWRCEKHDLTFPACPKCGDALKLQRANSPNYWCAVGRVWFDGELGQISKGAHLE